MNLPSFVNQFDMISNNCYYIIGDKMKLKDKIKSDVEKLEKIREIRDWSEEKMASKLSVTRQAYHTWVDGTSTPNVDSWGKIKNFLEG